MKLTPFFGVVRWLVQIRVHILVATVVQLQRVYITNYICDSVRYMC